MKRPVRWILGVACMLAAVALVAARPPVDSWEDPFPVAGEVHDVLDGRQLRLTVLDAAFADEVTDDGYEPITTRGNLLVVRLSAEARESEVGNQLGRVRLVVGDRIFLASRNVRETMLGQPLRVGTPTTGAVVFQLPADVRRGPATLQVASTTTFPKADSLLAVSLPLDGLDRVPSVAVEPPEVGKR